MLNTLDRYILRSLLINYVIALSVMISLYTVFDLFFNVDEFTEGGASGFTVLVGIFSYYANNIFKYFGQLSGVITLFACMITLARLRKQNELTAVLASGVSLYRVAVPVIAFGLTTTVLWYVNTEWIIPSVAHKLARRHDDPFGQQTHGVWFLNDRDGSLLSAQEFLPSSGRMKRVIVMLRDESGGVSGGLEADEARWDPIPGHPKGGQWLLERGIRRTRQQRDARAIGPQEQIEEQLVRVYESDLTPRDIQMRQSSQWIRFLSSSQLKDLSRMDLPNVQRIRQTRHERFATPVVNVVMLLLGIPFFLRRMPGNLTGDATRCLAVCGACFVVSMAGQSVSPASLPALPAWLPIILFAPLSVVLLDRVKT